MSITANPARRLSKQSGATLYEFAAIIPLLLLLMVGIVDFGRVMYAYHFLSAAARAATRWASVRGADCSPTYTTNCPATGANILAYVQTLAPPGMYVSSSAGCTTATVGCLTINCPTCSNSSADFIWPGTTTTGGAAGSDCTGGGILPVNNPGCDVIVQVEYTFGFGIPLFTKVTPSGCNDCIVLSSTSNTVISQ
jgi:Flp pilus assembly protein TadG